MPHCNVIEKRSYPLVDSPVRPVLRPAPAVTGSPEMQLQLAGKLWLGQLGFQPCPYFRLGHVSANVVAADRGRLAHFVNLYFDSPSKPAIVVVFVVL